MFNEDINDMDFSGGIRANRVFMETVNPPNAIFSNIFMIFIEMLKVTPDGVDMSDLRTRVSKEPIPKQTFSRWIQLMNGATEKRGLLNYKLSDKVLIRLEPSDNDPRAKKMVLTEEGLALARRMSRHDLERDYLKVMREGYEEHVDWMNSAEMKHARSLFEKGHTITEVEELMEQWKKDNPTLTREWQQTTTLDYPVPPRVTLEWLVEFQGCWQEGGDGDTKARQMMRDIGLQPDTYLLRMLSMSEWMDDGLLRIKIRKDHYKKRDTVSAIIGKFVTKAKMLESAKNSDWDWSKLNVEEVWDNTVMGTEYVLKHSKTGPNDIDVVDKATGEVKGGIEVKANAVDPATGTGHFTTIIATLTKQIDDMKKAQDERDQRSAEREQKLLDRIEKLTDALMEKK